MKLYKIPAENLVHIKTSSNHKGDAMSTYNFLAAAFFFLTALIGAGFASGREIVEFFVLRGKLELGGIFTAAACFYLISRQTVRKTKQFSAENIFALIEKSQPNVLARFLKLLLFLFLLAFSLLMLAALYAALCEITAAPLAVYILFSTFALAFSARKKIFIALTVLAAPFTITITLFCCTLSFYQHFFLLDGAYSLPPLIISCDSITAGALYALYNGALLMIALPPFIAEKNHNPCRGFLLGTILFAAMAALLLLIIACHLPEITTASLPMLAVCLAQPAASYALCCLSFLTAAASSLMTLFYNCRTFLPLPILLIFAAPFFSYPDLLSVLTPPLGICGAVIVFLVLRG
jgi:uncharacterized membrane protein YkvI